MHVTFKAASSDGAPNNLLTNTLHSWMSRNTSLQCLVLNMNVADQEILRASLQNILPNKETSIPG